MAPNMQGRRSAVFNHCVVCAARPRSTDNPLTKTFSRVKHPGWLGNTMKNNGWKYLLIVTLVLSGLAVLGNSFVGPEKGHRYAGVIREGIARPMPVAVGSAGGQGSDTTLDAHLIGIFGGALIIGCLAGFFLRRRPQRPETQRAQSPDSLTSLSSDTGINEYDLFCRAAENWAVSKKRMAQDFRIYMASQRLPFYVADLVRKNRLPEQRRPAGEKPEPSSWSDWIKALLVFPGSFVFLFVALVLLP